MKLNINFKYKNKKLVNYELDLSSYKKYTTYTCTYYIIYIESTYIL